MGLLQGSAVSLRARHARGCAPLRWSLAAWSERTQRRRCCRQCTRCGRGERRSVDARARESCPRAPRGARAARSSIHLSCRRRWWWSRPCILQSRWRPYRAGGGGTRPRLPWDESMLFTEGELEFLRSQRVGRLATVGPTGWPHVVPVMYKLTDEGEFDFDADGVKLRNLISEPRSAFVVDGSPKRGVAVQGRSRVIGDERARLTPERKFSWGL